MEELTCAACEQPFGRRRTLGRPPKYCSTDCRSEVARAPGALERLRFDRQLYVTRGRVFRPHVAIHDAEIARLEGMLERARAAR